MRITFDAQVKNVLKVRACVVGIENVGPSLFLEIKSLCVYRKIPVISPGLIQLRVISGGGGGGYNRSKKVVSGVFLS